MVTVHYFYDPMCGWCYGAQQLVEILNEHEAINLVLHPGGMIERREMSGSFRLMSKEHDVNIAQLTGQEFSAAYVARLEGSAPIILDSFITAQAVEVMQQHGRGVEMLAAIQHAHFVCGIDVSTLQNLQRLANDIDDQIAPLPVNTGQPINATIEQSRRLMNKWQVQGFPTFIVEQNHTVNKLNHTTYFDDIASWKDLLHSMSNKVSGDTNEI